MGLVAICISTYQRIDYIKRLLDSIRIQTYKDFVVVISDDTEDSSIEEVIKNYSDLNIDYHRNDKRLGSTCNTNNAIKMAKKYNPEFIKIMHHDDCFSDADSLLKMVQVISDNPDVDFVFAATNEKYPEREYVRLLTTQEWENLKEDFRILYTANYAGVPSATIVRNKDIWMDSNLIWYVDIDWYIQYLKENKNMIHIREPLITINHSETQVTQYCLINPKMCLNETLYLYKKYAFLHEDKYKDHLIEKIDMYLQQINLTENVKEGTAYIYGAGVWGQYCAKYLEQNGIAFNGFIVSDGQKSEEELFGHKIYKLGSFSEDELKNMKIILALNKQNKQEVLKELMRRDIKSVFSYI